MTRLLFCIFQAVASAFISLFGIVYTVRSIFERQDVLVVVSFAAVGYLGYKVARLSVDEYRNETGW